MTNSSTEKKEDKSLKSWRIKPEDWLNFLVDEIENVQNIDDIAHYFKNITLENKNLSPSCFWWFIDDCFRTNVIIILSKILEPCKFNSENLNRYSNDLGFTTFLKTLENNLDVILDKEDFIIKRLPNDPTMDKDYIEKFRINQDILYNELNGDNIKYEIEKDLRIIGKLSEQFKDFRNDNYAHMKIQKDNKNYEVPHYINISEAIAKLKVLVVKYKLLITGQRQIFPKLKDSEYGNVFDIPWNIKNID